ncbi:hypothetical protein SASPL_115240 [Salvia splendens]|uniref:DDE Tnp4 domain-containing protein n=1 Tax=Salvia splendens TaxID=180675 RepID=A0A8X8Y753_SALSN|nr:hypothetical protein SASPL_115240 [Salvia splendens]
MVHKPGVGATAASRSRSNIDEQDGKERDGEEGEDLLIKWEGSATDSRVLRDALTRNDPFIVPKDKYFLVDAGYTNGPGFLAPYREAPNDPLLDEVDAEIQTRVTQQGDDHNEGEENQPTLPGDYHTAEETQHSDRITVVQVTNEWTRFRYSLAEAMFLHYQNRRNF